MILLDTNALLWLLRGHRRSRKLSRFSTLYASPASLLELRMLVECGRMRLRDQTTVSMLMDDDRWALDSPPAAAWFKRSLDYGWTRDPFDRLIVAHARLRGWRLATGDGLILDQLDGGEVIEL